MKSRIYSGSNSLILLVLLSINFVTNGFGDDFSIPVENYPFAFPKDHGAHPDYRIEWWYLTGHLSGKNTSSDKKSRFGYQATFFRVAQAKTGPGNNFLNNGQFFMAHMALSDIDGKKFYHEEKMNRDGWDAYSRTDYLHCRNGNWTLRQDPKMGYFSAQLNSTIGSEIKLSFDLTSEKPPVIFGENGVSVKGAHPSARSLYITFPKLFTKGKLELGENEYEISGETWMDHEISSSQLDDDQIGWNWASIHLDSGKSIMVYMMRKKDGSKDPYSFFNLISSSLESVKQFSSKTFTWQTIRHWKSESTNSKYPVESVIQFLPPKSENEKLTGVPEKMILKPLLDFQEMESRISDVQYWEGACEVLNGEGKKIGKAYVELTGYGNSLTPLLSPTRQ